MMPSRSHNDTTLVLRRTFVASRERVFRAWITPRALEAWLRPRDMTMTVRALDARVGGSFRFELEDGSAIVGTYLQMVPPKQLAFTWPGPGSVGSVTEGHETVVTLDFFDLGLVTEVVLTHEGLSTQERRARAGTIWPSLLDALAEVLSSSQLDC
jgi:uncharacterized protein YndB with AHSA1/START domain